MNESNPRMKDLLISTGPLGDRLHLPLYAERKGWICPKCENAVSPDVKVCPVCCKPRKESDDDKRTHISE